jgi:hypothetical protein
MTEKRRDRARTWYAPWAWDVEYANDGSVQYPNARCATVDKRENFMNGSEKTFEFWAGILAIIGVFIGAFLSAGSQSKTNASSAYP